jgi:hypothetical protein
MSCLFAVFTVVTLLATSDSTRPAPRTCLPVPAGSAAEVKVLDEMRAFYRDLDDRNWPPLLDHFLPAKVAARWAPPTADRAWADLAAPAAETAADASRRCAPPAAVVIVGNWARVIVRRGAAGVDEAWLLHMGSHWKIVHLALAPSITP